MRKKIVLLTVLILNLISLVLSFLNLFTANLTSFVFGRVYISSTQLREDKATIQYSLATIKSTNESMFSFILLALFTIFVVLAINYLVFINKRKTGIFLIMFAFSKLTDYLFLIYNYKIAMTAFWLIKMIENSSFYFSLTFNPLFILSSFLLPLVLLFEGLILLFSPEEQLNRNSENQNISYVIDRMSNLPVLSSVAISFIGVFFVALSRTFSLFFSRFAILWYVLFIFVNIVIYSFLNFLLEKISKKPAIENKTKNDLEKTVSTKLSLVKLVLSPIVFVVLFLYSVSFWNHHVSQVAVKTTIILFGISIPSTDYIPFTLEKALFVIFLLFYLPLILFEVLKYWKNKKAKSFLLIKKITEQITKKSFKLSPSAKKVFFTSLLILLICIPFPLISFLSSISSNNLFDGGKIFYPHWEANSTITVEQMDIFTNGTFSCVMNISSSYTNIPEEFDINIIIFNSLIYDSNNNGYFDSFSYIYSVNSTELNSQISITQTEENYSRVVINSTGIFSIVGKVNSSFSVGTSLSFVFANVQNSSLEEYSIINSPIICIVRESSIS
ncbi:MAG: hypothetical protein K9W46_03855 [Candidatus Heimdallarchaeum endolithica]|uniref:Uncharacterized protein n=1 Tax=Candidatus Heimdallarchaeum endolithica TaxID=2876572 RepID=A0A9Y1FPB3_9ARCH|nr:MAG: hypothetical protein K9W46_03855 [Candidatus Heimdallarchaeum endolithica]